MAKIDVVIPCYNYGRYLRASVGSVLGQSVSDLRVLIIDDASSDDSTAVATQIAASDPRVSVLTHTANRGHINTYNEGIDWADSDYFLLLSADDILVENALQRAVEIMDANVDIVLTYGDCVAWQETDPLPRIATSEHYCWTRSNLLLEICETASNCVPTPTAIGRTRVQKAVGGYRPALPHSGDMEMWLRYAAHGQVAHINAVQAIYRKHGAAMSNTFFSALLSDYHQCQRAFDVFFTENSALVSNADSLATLARRSLARKIFRQGNTLMRRGRIRDGYRLMLEARRSDPTLDHIPLLLELLRPPRAHGRSRIVSALRNGPGNVMKWARGSQSIQRYRQ